MKKLSLYILILLSALNAFSQTNDTLSVVEKPISEHSPKKASIYSAVLPGLGQAYNKKYWKIPIVYAGLGGSAYFFAISNAQFVEVKNELQARFENNSMPVNPKFQNYADNSLISLKNSHQRNRELAIIVGVVFYVLNIVDASVDGHLYSFNVSENLSLRISPQTENIALGNYRKLNGISISLNF